MKNSYHRDIMNLLLPRGEVGMRLCRVVQNVYNLHNDLFTHKMDYTDLYRCLARYLWTQSRIPHSPFMRSRRGYYAIKPNIAVQLDIFIDEVPDEAPTKKTTAKRRARTTQLVLDF